MGVPPNGWCVMENLTEMDDLGIHHFGKPSYQCFPVLCIQVLKKILIALQIQRLNMSEEWSQAGELNFLNAANPRKSKTKDTFLNISEHVFHWIGLRENLNRKNDKLLYFV